MRSYKQRIFTTNAVGYEGVQHVDLRAPDHVRTGAARRGARRSTRSLARS